MTFLRLCRLGGAALLFALTSMAVLPAQNTALPGVQPQLAARGSQVFLTYGRGDAISVARSDDGGATFEMPVALPAHGKVSLGRHRGPRVSVTDSAVLVSTIAGQKGGGADGDIFLFRSMDAGRTWSKPTVVNDIPGVAREGLHAMSASPSGLVVIAWLDLREKGTRIYAASSRDHGATWTPDTLIYSSPSGSVCECCHPSLAIDGTGGVAVMFRNHVNGYRDMYVVRADPNGQLSAATKVGTGSWLLDACPMDGGGLTAGSGGLTAAWRRENAVFLSTSDVPERRLGTGRDVALASIGDVHDVAWSSSPDVMLSNGGKPALPVGKGGFPSLLAFKDKTVIAWEEAGTVRVRTIAR